MPLFSQITVVDAEPAKPLQELDELLARAARRRNRELLIDNPDAMRWIGASSRMVSPC